MTDFHRRLYGTPGLGEFLKEVAEAIYDRLGPFAAIPLSAFETFVLEQGASHGLDGKEQRRLCFERRMGFDCLGDVPLEGPWIAHDHPAARASKVWDEAWRRTWPASVGAIGDLRPSDARTLLDQLIVEGALPELALRQITNSGYSWTVERQVGDWLFMLTSYGKFSDKQAKKHGIGRFSVHLSSSARGKDSTTGGSTPIFGAFMESSPGIRHATLDWFIERHRDYARKVSAVAAFLSELSKRSN